VDRAELDRALREGAAERGVPLLRGTVGRVDRTGSGWSLHLHRPASTPLDADSVTLATGRGGPGAHRFALRRAPPTPMVAITTAAPGPFPQLGARLLVDAASDGWWYALGDGRRATIGFVTDADLMTPGTGFAATWAGAARTAEWLPAWARNPVLRGRRSSLSSAQPGDAFVRVVGDAALALDPLSGHGVTLAVEGALRAADDPASYPDWLADQDVTHRAQGTRLYRAAGRAGSFWQRRTGCVRT
jgi:flavin-dependent dehydrogenase